MMNIPKGQTQGTLCSEGNHIQATNSVILTLDVGIMNDFYTGSQQFIMFLGPILFNFSVFSMKWYWKDAYM